MTRSISNITWRLPRYKKDWKSICAILPAYLEYGVNGTMIYYIDGSTEQVERRLEWTLNDLLGYLCTSKEILQQKASDYMDHKNGRRMPLVVNQEMCLIPVRGRKAISRHDTTLGYVVLEYVQAIQRINSDKDTDSISGKRAERMRVQQRIVEQTKAEQEQDGKTMVFLSKNWQVAVYDSIRILHQNLNLGAALKYRFGQEA